MPENDRPDRETIELMISDPATGNATLRADAAANRELILATAETLFAERGVAEVNMADIAEAAGVGKGTLYRRFASKAELSLALMDAQTTEFQDDMMDQLRRMTGQDVPYLDQLRLFLGALVQFTEENSPLLCVVEAEGMLAEEGARSRPYFWQYLTTRGLLQAAARAGEIPAELDTNYLADALLAPLHIELFRHQRRVKGFSLERITAGLESLLAGLGQPRR